MRYLTLLFALAFLVACETAATSVDLWVADTSADVYAPGEDLGPALDVAPDSGLATPDVSWDAGGLADVPAVPDVAAADLAAEVEDTWAPDLPPCPSPEALAPPAVGGLIYEDGDRSARSYHVQAMTPPADRPLSGVPVTLLGLEGSLETVSCPDGRFSFGALAEGVYMLSVAAEPGRSSTSHSLARRLPAAIAEGELVMVSFGDSIPVEGGEPFFPAVLEGLLSPFVAVDNRVVARGGSTSSEWVPGSNYFENRLGPHLADADLIIGSVGGNDLSEFFDVYSTDFEREALVAKLTDFPAFLDEVTGRIVSTLEEIRARAPQADVVYLLYTNYARSSRWEDLAGDYSGLAVYGLDNALRIMRATIGGVEGVLLADMMAATASEDIDPYLWDEIHLSTAGAERWAREIFLLLGGVVVGEEPMGLERLYGLSPLATRR